MNIVYVITVIALALALAVVLVIAFVCKRLIYDTGKALSLITDKYNKEFDDVLIDYENDFRDIVQEDVDKLISKF